MGNEESLFTENFIYGEVLCIVGCLAESLASTHYIPIPLSPHTNNHISQEGKIELCWEPPVQMKWHVPEVNKTELKYGEAPFPSPYLCSLSQLAKIKQSKIK